MEIERKFKIKSLPSNLESYANQKMIQGYLCTSPVVRIRRSNDEFYLTYKGSGMMAREEYNLALTEEAYYHLRDKIKNGKFQVDQGIIAGCAGGGFENICAAADILKGRYIHSCVVCNGIFISAHPLARIPIQFHRRLNL